MKLKNYLKTILIVGLVAGCADNSNKTSYIPEASAEPKAKSSAKEAILGGAAGIALITILLVKSFEHGIEDAFENL
jgi:hypothetical protein